MNGAVEATFEPAMTYFKGSCDIPADRRVSASADAWYLDCLAIPNGCPGAGADANTVTWSRFFGPATAELRPGPVAIAATATATRIASQLLLRERMIPRIALPSRRCDPGIRLVAVMRTTNALSRIDRSPDCYPRPTSGSIRV